MHNIGNMIEIIHNEKVVVENIYNVKNKLPRGSIKILSGVCIYVTGSVSAHIFLCAYNQPPGNAPVAQTHCIDELNFGINIFGLFWMCFCRSITAKPTYIKKEKDIPRLPEIWKKLYQYFRLFYFHSHNNIAVISLLLHVVDTYQTRTTPQYIFIQILRIYT